MLTTGVVCLIHMPCGQRLGDGHFNRVYPLPWPATMELDQIPVEIPGQIRWGAATLALLTVPRFLFPRCFYYEESKKQRHREFALCRYMLYASYKPLTRYLLFCPVGVNGRRHTLPERS